MTPQAISGRIQHRKLLPTAAELGDRAATHYDVLLAALLKAGTTTLGFDGQNFFDTDHPIDAIAGTGSHGSGSASTRPRGP